MPPARTVAAPEMSPEPLAAVQAEPAVAAQVQLMFVRRVASNVSATEAPTASLGPAFVTVIV